MDLRTRSFPRPCVLALLCLAVPLATACDGKSGDASGKKPAKSAGKEGEAGKKGKGVGGVADDAKSKAAARVKAQKDGKQAKPDRPAKAAKAAGGGRTFRKGQVAPRGLTNDEVKAYAVAQGDPRGGEFTLAQALEGDATLSDKSKGKLHVTFHTTNGEFECELYEDQTPLTVANFVGLGRGVRESYDKKADTWEAKPFYDGIIFHRVIAGFMIQTGDPTGSGTGGPGYVVVDEFDKSLKHTGPGYLSMANRGPNTGSSQFFVTVAKTPHLDGKHAIFGKCADAKVPIEISKVKVDARRGNRPYEQVKIDKLSFTRK
ncbi:MAG: peptidylprolyl isomerase [Myxococcota bacterium]